MNGAKSGKHNKAKMQNVFKTKLLLGLKKAKVFFSFIKGPVFWHFPIFFVTILMNLYQSTLLTHELLLDHQRDNIK